MSDRTIALNPIAMPEKAYTNKTSVLVPSQLPEFVRDDINYETFVSFLKAYYEWMEQENGVTFNTKGIPQFTDVDTTLDGFVEQFKKQYLAFFPTGSAVDERKVIKMIRQVYQTKGTPASFEFLFRVLYNSDVNLYNTKDFIFRASDGKWIATRSLKLATTDQSWLRTKNYKLFGETSKAYATIENIFINGNNVRLVLSRIQGNFAAGEIVKTVDVHGRDYKVDDVLPRSRIVGLLSSVTIDKVNHGNSYSVGDPVVFYGGLDTTVENPVGAEAYISSVTSASIKGVTSAYPGHGYRKGAFTEINLTGAGANAKSIVTKLNDKEYDIFLVPSDTIGPKANIFLGNTAFSSGANPAGNSIYYFANLINANANTTLAEALTFPLLKTYGIDSVEVVSVGTGYDGRTIANAIAYYTKDTGEKTPLPNLGILPPPVIVSGGRNYNVGDTIDFTGGSGYGAWAVVTAISNQTAAITEVTFVSDPDGQKKYPLGGMGYQIMLPDIVINSSTGSGAVLQFPGLVGNDAAFGVVGSPYGQILEITLSNPGENYVSTPNVSLRIEDILVATSSVTPIKGDRLYQGDYDNPTYQSTIDTVLGYSANTIQIRTYEYNGVMNANTTLSLVRGSNTISTSVTLRDYTDEKYTTGRKIYGNGIAKAQASFTNGITLGSGLYSNEDGHPSAYSVFENEIYNEYTYLLQVEEALAKYKTAVFGFLHPLGLNYNTYNILKNQEAFNYSMQTESLNLSPLKDLIGTTGYLASISNNTVSFTNIDDISLSDSVLANSYITISTKNGDPFTSKITSVYTDTLIMEDSCITTVPNVATATVTAGSDTINISNLTQAWNIATGNGATYFSDFMHTYDYVSFDGTNYKLITHVDQPETVNGTLFPPATIRVNSVYSTAQSGHLSFRQNTNSSNVWISSINLTN
jgi:flagellar basal body rod protein FlgB